MRQAIGAGALYFLLIFGLGFVLGTVRTLVIEPRLGLDRATLIELPAMLAASWLACGWVVRRVAVGRNVSARLLMGGVAFLMLMAGELGVSTLLMARSIAEHFGTYGEAARQWGLLAQVAFALFPLVRLYISAESSA